MKPQVTSWCSTNRCRRVGSARSASVSSSISPPTDSGTNMSSTEASNPRAANPNERHRSPSSSAPVSLANSITQLTTLAWVTTTPFGRPVEPDVYMT